LSDGSSGCFSESCPKTATYRSLLDGSYRVVVAALNLALSSAPSLGGL
jgi:hypothetical protein